jgi:HAD superfamily hydrolase (TIGR01509 family)
MAAQPIAAVFLDVGGTLWPDIWPPNAGDDDFRLSRLQPFLPNSTPDQCHELIRRLIANLEEFDRALTQETDGPILRTVAQFDRPSAVRDAAAIRKALCLPARDRAALFPGAEALLQSIKRLGLRCVVLSNAITRDAEIYLDDFEKLGVAGYIDDVISFVDVGYRKPHPAIFETAVAAAQAPAARCAIIGNSERNDIQPALALGMRTIRVAIEEPAPSATAAHALATSLAEAAAILKSWAT